MEKQGDPAMSRRIVAVALALVAIVTVACSTHNTYRFGLDDYSER